MILHIFSIVDLSAHWKMGYNRQMKRFLVVGLIFLVSGFILLRVIREKVGHDLSQPIAQPALSPTPTVTIDRLHNTTTSLFVPDWALDTIPGN